MQKHQPQQNVNSEFTRLARSRSHMWGKRMAFDIEQLGFLVALRTQLLRYPYTY